MKVLKLSSYFYPEQVSSSHLSNDLYEAYKRVGIETEIYSPTPSRGITNDVRKKYSKIKYEEFYDGTVKLHRFSMLKEGKNPLFRAFRYFLVNCVQYYKGSHAKNIDLIYSGSTPPTQGLLCGLIKRKLQKKDKHKIPFIYALQDIFPDSLVNSKMTKKGSIVWRIGRKIEDYTYKSADKIIVISEDFKNNIIEKGVPNNKIVIIPNWINTETVFPIDRKDNILFDKYNLDRDKFYICYSGNLGHSQNLGLLLRAAIKLQKNYSDICFVLIGEGAAKDSFKNLIKEKEVKNIILLPFQPYEDIAHVFSLGDAGLVISKPGIGGSSVPSKTWSIMASARPVLASFDKNSELSKLISKEKCGLCSDPNDVNDFISCILQLRNDPSLCKKMGHNGLSYVRNNLSKEKCTSRYIKLLKSVVREKHE